MSTSFEPQSPPVLPVDPRVRRMELIISNLLRVGVAASLLLVIVGTVVTFAKHPNYWKSPAALQHLIEPGAAFPHSLTDVVTGLREFRGEAIVTLGLLVLIATPMMRVAVSIFAFIYQGDRVYTLITAAVFALLMLSLALGRVH